MPKALRVDISSAFLMSPLPSVILYTYFFLTALRQVSTSPQPSRPSPSVTSTIFATPISSFSISASSASPLCYAQNQDPGLGFLSQFCICTSGTAELHFPFSTPTPSPVLFHANDYCAYTTIVSTSILQCLEFLLSSQILALSGLHVDGRSASSWYMYNHSEM